MKAAFFDLDGTLVDSLKGITEGINLTRKSENLPALEPMTVRQYIGHGTWNLIRQAFPKPYKDQDIDRLELEFQQHYTQTWKSGTTPFDGIPGLLGSLHQNGIQLGVLSNKKHTFTVRIVESLFGRDLIPQIYGLRHQKPKKPHPEALLAMVHHLGLSSSEVCYVGDSTIDLETAKSAQLQGIAVTWGYHDKAQLLPYGTPICDTVAQLASLLTISDLGENQ